MPEEEGKCLIDHGGMSNQVMYIQPVKRYNIKLYFSRDGVLFADSSYFYARPEDCASEFHLNQSAARDLVERHPIRLLQSTTTSLPKSFLFMDEPVSTGMNGLAFSKPHQRRRMLQESEFRTRDHSNFLARRTRLYSAAQLTLSIRRTLFCGRKAGRLDYGHIRERKFRNRSPLKSVEAS
jgi:hypothetical protein